MSIKKIFDEISAESGDIKKMEILSKYKDNELLKRVLYLCKSKRIKFYIKQIPEYPTPTGAMGLDSALEALDELSSRKVTGHSAIGHLFDILVSVSVDDAYIIERIIEKDCKIGMGTSNINKVFPKLIEETGYMGAKSFDEKLARNIFEKGGVGYSQKKFDGRYCNSIIRDGDVELCSRQGEATIVTGAKFLEELSLLDNCVLNGELTMANIPRYESNGIIASIIDITGKKEDRTPAETAKKISAFEEKHGSFEKALNSIIYTVWDRISVDEYFNQESNVPYDKRLSILSDNITSLGLTMVQFIETRVVNNYFEAMEHFQELLANGDEGTILKASKGVWRDGKKNNQIKMKLEMDVDLRITGFNYGGKGTKNESVISSFNAESSDGLLKTKPQGLKEDMMKYITENQDKLLGTIIQCRSCGLSKDSNGNHSLLHPVFVELRGDKNTCDSLESIKEIENMVKSLSTK